MPPPPDHRSAQLLEVYDRHAAVMYALALRMLGPGPDAETVVEDAFIRWVQGDITDGPTIPTGARLMTVTRSRAEELMRMRTLTPGAASVGPVHAPHPAASMPPLPDIAGDQRHVLDRVYFDGISLESLARQRRVPVAEVRNDLWGAFAQLRVLTP